jgi:hypothetical protein
VEFTCFHGEVLLSDSGHILANDELFIYFLFTLTLTISLKGEGIFYYKEGLRPSLTPLKRRGHFLLFHPLPSPLPHREREQVIKYPFSEWRGNIFIEEGLGPS